MFELSTNDQAFLKAGFMGFTGTGKTYTGVSVALGLHRLCKSQAPVYFLDTETGADWQRSRFAEAHIELRVAKTRAFKDLVPAVMEAENANAILIIDSITHFWREITESYMREKRRQRLLFQDWAWLKTRWGEFTDAFVNSSVHIIMCGRAGYEYDFFEDDAGKKELEKTGIKMKAETETGYEPSILVLMSRHQRFDADHPEQTKTVRFATVLKDRGGVLDGKVFQNPTFEDFLPHIECLNLGGRQVGVDTSRNSTALVPPDSGEGRLRREQITIALDEIKECLVKHHPGQSADAKRTKGDILEEIFGTRSWAKIETYALEELQVGRDLVWRRLEGRPYVIGGGVVTSDAELDAKVTDELTEQSAPF